MSLPNTSVTLPAPLPQSSDPPPRVLTEGERRVRAAARHGIPAELGDLPEDEQVLGAALLTELLTAEGTDEQGRPYVHPRGVRVLGAHTRITDQLDLTHQTVRVPLELTGCILEQRPQLDHATLPALALNDCTLPGLEADRLAITHGLSLMCSRITDTVRLSGAQIGGELDCSGATLSTPTPDGNAVIADGATISGGVILRPFVQEGGGQVMRCEIRGGVRLVAARIGSLECDGAKLICPNGDALDAQDATINGPVYLRAFAPKGSGWAVPCEITGGVWMSAVTVGGNLEFFGAKLRGGAKYALNLRRAEIKGVLGLGAARPPNVDEVIVTSIEGQVVLRGARILGWLDGDGTEICYGSEDDVLEEDRGALLAEQAQISGDVRLRAFYTLDGSGHQRLVPCAVTGGVILKGAGIGGSLRGDGATLRGNDLGTAGLSASRAEIAQAVYLRALAPPGEHPTDGKPPVQRELVPCAVTDLRLNGARIRGRLDLTGARLAGAARLSGCHAGELADDLGRDPKNPKVLTGCWSRATEVALNGFTYDRFAPGHTNADPKLRRDWLRDTVKARGSFFPAPWDQLRGVYAQNGQGEDARRIAIAKQQHRVAAANMHPLRRFWLRLLGWTIGYGYRPARAGIWALVAIALLTFLMWVGRSQFTYIASPMTPTAPAGPRAAAPVPSPASTPLPRNLDPPTAFEYAADVFIPVADFKVVDEWRIRGWLEPVRFLFVGLGWLLGTIFIAGFTRIVRR